MGKKINLDEVLGDIFIQNGSSLTAEEIGEKLSHRVYEIPQEFNASLIRFVNEQVREADSKQDPKTDISPFCNTFLLMFQEMEFIADYYSSIFELKTSDDDFKNQLSFIWPELIRGWYFREIYLAYGEEFEEIDKQAFIRKGKNWELDGIKGKFRLFTKASGENKFFSVLSEQDQITLDKTKQAKMCKFSLRKNKNLTWLYWWHLMSNWLQGMKRFDHSIKHISKNILLTPKSADDERNIREQFDNYDCFIKRDGKIEEGSDTYVTTTQIEETAFLPRENCLAILECVSRGFEERASHLGYAGKFPDQSKDRKNSGENFHDMNVIFTIRTSLINSLKCCFNAMRDKFPNVVPKDLEITPTNMVYAQGLPQPQLNSSFSSNPTTEGNE